MILETDILWCIKVQIVISKLPFVGDFKDIVVCDSLFEISPHQAIGMIYFFSLLSIRATSSSSCKPICIYELKKFSMTDTKNGLMLGVANVQEVIFA